MALPSKEADKPPPQEKRWVTVVEPKEHGMSKGQIVVLAMLALIVIGAAGIFFLSYDTTIRP